MDSRVWVDLYDQYVPESIDVAHSSLLGYFTAHVAASPESVCLQYMSRALSWKEVDDLSNGFAANLRAHGFVQGDRLLLSLQNVPEFVIATLGGWKAGCVLVPTNPMYRRAELDYFIRDSGSTGMVLALEETQQIEVARRCAQLELLIGVDPLNEIAGDEIPPALVDAEITAPVEGIREFNAFCADGLAQGTIVAHEPKSGDVGFIAYTSGTTGPQKGARNTHANIAFASQVYQQFLGLQSSDSVFALAPLSHMTGLIAHMGIGIATGCPIVMGYRFDASTYLRLINRYRCSFVVGSITAYQSFMEVLPQVDTSFSSVTRAYSGGAPVSPALVERFERMTGCYIHNCFGMTETTSPAVLTPVGRRAPVDQSTGALSIGVPVPDTVVSVHDDDGHEVPSGEVGELYIDGPQVVPGYWDKDSATRSSFTSDGKMRSGDIGSVDENGWVYLIDRKKDQINTSGFKVWPREVEDIIYRVGEVEEVIVVGLPDEYRGETVCAFVKIDGSQSADEDVAAAIDDLCREELAAYKRPRAIHVVDKLPKTPTGKLSRHALRSASQG